MRTINLSDTRSLVVEAASVTSEAYDIIASNDGMQVTEVKMSGDVAGGFAGILAANLTVEAATIAAAAADGVAVYAINGGKGATTVKASGLAEGSVFVSNDDDATELTFDVAGVNGGVGAFNESRGATRVKASGAVTGGVSRGALTGILAWNIGPATTDLTGDAASVAGGIQAVNWATGATGVTASGAVTSTTHGVFAHSERTS